MKTIQTISIKGTELRCKDHVKENFEQIPTSLNNYVRYDLIKPNDVYTYTLLMQYDNASYGYAWPPIETLQMECGGASDGTIRKSIKRLVSAGLIRREKSPMYPNKHIYFVDLPHSVEELKRLVPKKSKAYDEYREKLLNRAKMDRERLNQLK
ncbi:helix-turn-helix domain-containing protein [Peribacillus frigoritolerans]|uniref:helix-turn-helix domain-containing protein n=1 Tax=Peribacillus frigoritolerans TaxID=450367 RepID=UPI001F4F6326|nr:helix-turn-helix domain-containing protein [Peribacillus frigoritolerans]MCK2018847.1 helix-turn-helix domain-containing protein [Peribacillus frigoritolerans]